MDKKIIKISGNTQLNGLVSISGAKNAALPGLAASILSSDKLRINNVPEVNDVHVMIKALQSIGSQVVFQNNSVHAEMKDIRTPEISASIVGSIRASILFLGPMLARFGYVKVSQPGGCPIGHRGVDFHFEGLRRMGATIEIVDNCIVGRVDRLRGMEYSFPGKTVTGTENLIMAASLADGDTMLRNCALEPEIDDLIQMLNKMGADIYREKNDTIIIKGQTSLSTAEHHIIPDRIEMGTYVIAAAMADHQIAVSSTRFDLVRSLLDILDQMGVMVQIEADRLTILKKDRLKGISLETAPFPGFPTDLQAQLMVLLTQIEGESRIRESIFNNRFNHAGELNKMGADISINDDIATIRGKTALTGCPDIYATDLRASATLVLGSLIADGETTIHNASQLFRGYEDLPGKLSKLGADISVYN